MPITVYSPHHSPQGSPLNSRNDPTRTQNDSSSSADDSSYLNVDDVPTSPISPMSPGFQSFLGFRGFGDIRSELKSAQPSRDDSRKAIAGSSKAGTEHKVLREAYNKVFSRATAAGLANQPLHEEEAGANVLDSEVESDKGLELDEEQGEQEEKIVLNNRVIGVDFDDVCSLYIPKLCAEHNAKYGTDITPEDFNTYIFWQNRGWGTPAETQRKLSHLEKQTPIDEITPVPGFASALKALKALGHEIHIVSARPSHFKDNIEAWLGMQGVSLGDGLDDTVKAVWCCSSYLKEELPERRETTSGIQEEENLNEKLLGLFARGKSGMSKLKVLREIKAELFIDDHHGNLEAIVGSEQPIHCLLFGDYPWNQSRSSGLNSPGDVMTYDQRVKAGLKITVEDVEMGLYLHRVRGWADVVKWVKKWDKEAMEVDE